MNQKLIINAGDYGMSPLFDKALQEENIFFSKNSKINNAESRNLYVIRDITIKIAPIRITNAEKKN